MTCINLPHSFKCNPLTWILPKKRGKIHVFWPFHKVSPSQNAPIYTTKRPPSRSKTTPVTPCLALASRGACAFAGANTPRTAPRPKEAEVVRGGRTKTARAMGGSKCFEKERPVSDWFDGYNSRKSIHIKWWTTSGKGTSSKLALMAVSMFLSVSPPFISPETEPL